MSLPAFFDAMLPFFMGEISVGALEATIGPSRSGTARLAFYQELARRDRAVVLLKLYGATRAAAECCQKGLFGELVNAHLARHRSRHWEPNRFGEPFPSLVAELCPDQPLLSELSDYEWLKFEVSVGQGEPVYFRSYEYDVVGFAHRFAQGGPAEIPTPRAIAVAVHRSRVGRAVATVLGAAELAALARRRGLPSERLRISEAAIAAAEKGLIRRGVLSP